MLSAGTKLGPYEITGALGAGGMGEVYRARDTRLNRDVALKVLPEAFARDAERMARLRREAQVLASLNHPNIAAIYGFEDSGGAHALVMELVEGPTLAERIKSSAIPLDEALSIAKQICEAVEYAHERGIVHRDLKPSNIKIAQSDAVKILDFGLAKAIEGDPSTTSVENSPTLSAMATHAGFLLGTAAYMSPEQARGKKADRRADIWAFGVVLYEMLSGKRLFTGETSSDTLAAVIRAEPDWNELPAQTPVKIRELMQRCLRKDPRQRLQSIGDARILMGEVLSGAQQEGAAPDTVGATTRERLGWGAAAVVTIIAALFAAGYFLRAPQAPKPAQAVVAQIASPDNANFSLWGVGAGAPALSPDGTQLAFVAKTADGRDLLFVRPLNSATARPLDRTDGASFPFWSPDSRSLGYFAKTDVYRIDVSGGPPVAIGAVGRAAGAAWGGDGTILLGATIATSDEMQRIPVSGGKAEPAGKFGPLRQFWWPQSLPDGKHFLFYAASSESSEDAGTYVAALTGEPKLILPGGSAAVYAPPGYLLFVRDGTLMAQRFDARNLSLASQAMPLAENVGVNLVSRRGIFTVSENGTLVYETATSEASRILWYDRSGKQIDETATSADLGTPSISPDGRKLALSDGSAGKPDVWVYDLARGIKTRITSSPGINGDALWSPDGTNVCFVSNRDGRFHLYQEAADGTGKATPLTAEDAAVAEFFGSWSADGRYLAFQRSIGARVPSDNGPASGEVWALPLFGDRKPFPVVQNGEFVAIEPALSPDAKWLAYVSDESGTDQIYIVPFPHGGGKWQVSSAGGSWPKWRRDGKELFFRVPDDEIASVEIAEQGGDLIIGKTQALFQANPGLGGLGAMYDVSADGKKFVVVSRVQKTYPPFTVVTNWPALLKK